MYARNEAPTPADLAAEANSLTAGLGILTMTFAPFALPGLLLALPFVLPLIPLLLVGGAVYLLVRALRRLGRFARGLGSAERAGHHTRGHPVVE